MKQNSADGLGIALGERDRRGRVGGEQSGFGRAFRGSARRVRVAARNHDLRLEGHALAV